MPFTQQRAIAIVKAGLFYSAKLDDLRETLQFYILPARLAIVKLEESNASEDLKESAQALWETIRAIVDKCETISLEELAAFKTLIEENKHFDSGRVNRNNAQARYNRKYRSKGNNASELSELKQPQQHRPKTTTEQTQNLIEVHRRLWNIEDKESWVGSELCEAITATLPQQSPTAILNELCETKRIVFIKATNKYIIENPNEEISK